MVTKYTLHPWNSFLSALDTLSFSDFYIKFDTPYSLIGNTIYTKNKNNYKGKTFHH